MNKLYSLNCIIILLIKFSTTKCMMLSMHIAVLMHACLKFLYLCGSVMNHKSVECSVNDLSSEMMQLYLQFFSLVLCLLISQHVCQASSDCQTRKSYVAEVILYSQLLSVWKQQRFSVDNF